MSENMEAIETVEEVETDAPVSSKLDPAEIARNPQKYGFKWDYSDGVKSEGRTLRAKVPNIVIPMETEDEAERNLTLFSKAFGWKIAARGVNGTGIKVRVQSRQRAMLTANATISNNDMEENIVRTVLLRQIERTSSGAKVRHEYKGVVYASADAMQEAIETTMRQDREKQADEMKRELIGKLVAGGMSPADAIALIG